MVSRESRVAGIAIVCAVGFGVVMGFSGLSETVPYGPVIVAILVFPGLSLLAPQLYLALTTTDAAMRRRHLRVGLGLSGALLLFSAPVANPASRSVVAVSGAGLLTVLLLWEALRGYYESSLFEDATGE
jgi:hypothetical protein